MPAASAARPHSAMTARVDCGPMVRRKRPSCVFMTSAPSCEVRWRSSTHQLDDMNAVIDGEPNEAADLYGRAVGAHFAETRRVQPHLCLASGRVVRPAAGT